MSALAMPVSMNPAQAAIFKDAQLERLQDAGKYAEPEQKAQARVKANAVDAEAGAHSVWRDPGVIRLALPAPASR
ncbi:hypothetical protein [Massilia scottii]|uniref:hypothetical protein n=1 Tax=Massilia scottii TaxID=3057166 RepID=UPI002796B12C|nr:hypothetical protein [Massilia sp. CCM 9029]MDQ1833589.1 hypothetical protein [Massilia sp. CCM 9029]